MDIVNDILPTAPVWLFLALLACGCVQRWRQRPTRSDRIAELERWHRENP